MSLLGGSNAFISFSASTPTPTVSAPPQSFDNTNPTPTVTAPVVVPEIQVNNTTIDEAFIARLALKDEDTIFQQDLDVQGDFTIKGIAVGGLSHTDIDDRLDHHNIFTNIQRLDGILAGVSQDEGGTRMTATKEIEATNFFFSGAPDRNIKNEIDALNAKTIEIAVQDTILPSGLPEKITRFDGITAFMFGLSIADGKDISFDGDTTTLANFKTKINNLELDLADGGATNIKISDLEQKTAQIEQMTVTPSPTIPSFEVTQFNSICAFQKGLAIASGHDISFDGDTQALSTFKTKIGNLETNSRTNADLNTFISNHANVKTDAELNTFIEANTEFVTVENRLKAVEDTFENVFRDMNKIVFENDILLNTGQTLKYHNSSGIQTNLIQKLESLEASIGSSRTDAQLNTFIDNHQKLTNISIIGSEMIIDTDTIIKNGKNFIVETPTRDIDVANDIVGLQQDILTINENTDGFSRDTPKNETKFTDKIIADVMTHGTYTHSTGFRHLFPESGPRDDVPLNDMDILKQIGTLLDTADLNTRLTIMFNLRLNGRSASNGGQGYEYMFGMPQAGFDQQTANTMRLMGEEIFIGRPSDLKITEVGQENNIENTEIPLIDTINNLMSFRDNINTNIDSRVTTVTTSLSNETISSLIHSNLTLAGLITKYSITAKFQGQWVTEANRGAPTLGFFTGHYHSANPTWGLFVFGLNDSGLLKMVGKYFDISDDNLPFKEDMPFSRWSREFLYPTGLNGNDKTFEEFIVKSWNSAEINKVIANPNNSNIVERVTANDILFATLPNFAGYGVDTIVSSVVSRGFDESVLTLTTDVNSVKTSLTTNTNSINNLSTTVNGLNTVYAPLNSSYTKAVSDAKYSLTSEVEAFKVNINTVHVPKITSNEAEITNINNAIGDDTTTNTLKFRIKTNETNITSINSSIGDDATPSTIKGKIKVNENNITNLVSQLSALSTTVTTNKTVFDSLNVDTRLVNNAVAIQTLEGDVDLIEIITDNMLFSAGLLQLQSNVKFMGNIQVRTDVPTIVHLGKGQVLYDFPSGEADIPTKILNIEDNTFFQSPNNNLGKSLNCNNVNVLRGSTYLPVLTANDFRELLINNVDAVSGKVQQNTVLIAGPNLIIPKSPNPIVFVDSDGRLGSSALSEDRYDDQVFGADNRGEDGNAEDNNENKYKHGLVPSYIEQLPSGEFIGSSISCLTADGTWRKISSILPTLESVPNLSAHLPDFVQVKASDTNKFCKISLINGGTIHYSSATTDEIQEGSNLYHTNARVDARVQSQLSGGFFTNIVSDIVSSQQLIATSDRRLKTDIETMKYSESIVDKLRPVNYRFKGKSQMRRGLIAQEVRALDSTCVHENRDSILGINYPDLISHLILEIQELKKEVKQLKEKLT